LQTSKKHIKKQLEWDLAHRALDKPKIDDHVELLSKKDKTFEYDLCSLLIKLNLPFTDSEPIFDFVKKN